MAICLVKSSKDLGVQFVLTPERYNPRRRMVTSEDDGILLSEVISLINDVISIKQAGNQEYYQINTSDAMEGCLRVPGQKCLLNSSKKMLKEGDVIISRLRPYLRQVAFVDTDTSIKEVCASTEFYVMRSSDNESIAYLVPFLLSDEVQKVFANAVEGSQHPRFKEDDLLNLIIPRKLFECREAVSAEIVASIKHFREYEAVVSAQIRTVNDLI